MFASVIQPFSVVSVIWPLEDLSVHSWENESEVDKQHLSIIREIVFTSQNFLEGLKDS